MHSSDEFDKPYAEEQLRRSRHPLHRLIKKFYIENILADVQGPTIDIGCGAGQLLAKLPSGSVGLEVNPFLVETLKGSGLTVLAYNIEADDFGLSVISSGDYKTIILSHVLEHFDDAADALRRLICSAKRLGVERIIIVVPGIKGYASDKTHKTFVNRSFLKTNKLENFEGYRILKVKDFPFSSEIAGKYFIYQELKIVYEQCGN